MAKKAKRTTRGQVTPPVVQPDAAGIDIGATEIYVAVPSDRDSAHDVLVDAYHWPFVLRRVVLEFPQLQFTVLIGRAHPDINGHTVRIPRDGDQRSELMSITIPK